MTEAQTLDAFTISPNFQDHLHDVIDMALGVDTTWDRQPDQIHFRGRTEHERTDLDGPDPTLEVELGGEGDSGELFDGMCGTKPRASR